MENNKLNNYEKDENGYFKIINGEKIYQIEEKTESDRKTNDAINSFRQRPKGQSMSEWLNSQF